MKIKSFRPKQFKNPLSASPQNGKDVQSQQQSGQSPYQKPQEFDLGDSKNSIKLLSLGGIGEVTRNMFVYEYKDDIVIVDCGVGFPDEGMLGIDLVIPDISYLKDKKHKIRGIILSHGHEDHIGGLAYIWPQLGDDIPIYSQKLTCGLIRAKFTEHKLPKDKIKALNIDDTVDLGSFKASFYQVAHSVPDSTGIVLRTPLGVIVHQSDFKIDWSPVNGQVTDVKTLARFGSEGIIFMTIDCLRSEKAGYTLSEKHIQPTFERVEESTQGKVFITMTSSNVTRIQQAINVAEKSGRKIALSGRSMEVNFQVARDLGYLDVPPGLIIAQDAVKRFPPDKMMILIAGSQGQPESSLARAANNDHKFIEIKKEDSVVFSADPIPGTESAQYALIDTLTKLGCNVYYSALTSDLHVSGHAAAEELKVMLNLASPNYVMPIGGNVRHMKAFTNLAKEIGFRGDQIIVPNDGQMVNITQNKVTVGGSIPIHNVYVDGLGVGDVGTILLRDRQVMSEEGIVIVVVPIDQRTGNLSGEIEVISRGFVFEESSEDLLEASKEIVAGSLREHNSATDWRYVRKQIEDHLEKFFYGETKRTPLILPVVVEV